MSELLQNNGTEALAIDITVKLARVPRIVPVSVVAAAFMGFAPVAKDVLEGGKLKVLCHRFFVDPSSCRLMGTYVNFDQLGDAGLTAMLFLIEFPLVDARS